MQEVINRMGAVSVNLSGGEVINSLKLGVLLDAAGGLVLGQI